MPEAITAIKRSQQLDGVDEIGNDGTITFNAESIEILKRELLFELPRKVAPHDLEQVAQNQIATAMKAITIQK
jgi:hypothetical protein